MDSSSRWFGGGRFAGFSDDEIRAIQEGAAVRLRQQLAALRQEGSRSAEPRSKRHPKRKAA